MPELFTLEQLVTFMQRNELERDVAELALTYATIEIRNRVGATRWAAYTDVSYFFPLGLRLARRVVHNPEGLRSETIDDYKYEISVEDLRPPELTEQEKDEIDALVEKLDGRGSAFSITPAAPTPYYPYPRPAPW